MPKGKSTSLTETQVTKTIKDWLALKKIYTLRLQTGNLMASYGGKKVMVPLCPTGTPDLFTIINGKSVFFEVKRDQAEVDKWKKRVADYVKTNYAKTFCAREIAQYHSHESIRKNGGFAFLVSDVREVEAIVNEIQNADCS